MYLNRSRETAVRVATTPYVPRNATPENIAAAVRSMGADAKKTRRGDRDAARNGNTGSQTQSL